MNLAATLFFCVCVFSYKRITKCSCSQTRNLDDRFLYPQFVLSKNKKISHFLQLKISIFTAVKYYSILYGRVIVISCYYTETFKPLASLSLLFSPSLIYKTWTHTRKILGT